MPRPLPYNFHGFYDPQAIENQLKQELLDTVMDSQWSENDPTAHFVACLELNDQVQFEAWAL